MLESLKAALELGGHSTEVAGLHPILQANWEEARSVLEDITSPIGFAHDFDIPEDYVRAAYFAARTKDHAWFEDNDYQPTIQYLGQRVDLFEIPSPFAITIASKTSARVAIVVVQYSDVNEAGYGDWASALYWVASIEDDADAATNKMIAVGRAMRTMAAVIKQMDRTRRDFGPGKVDSGLAF
jgi:hypothetical protein